MSATRMCDGCGEIISLHENPGATLCEKCAPKKEDEDAIKEREVQKSHLRKHQ